MKNWLTLLLALTPFFLTAQWTDKDFSTLHECSAPLQTDLTGLRGDALTANYDLGDLRLEWTIDPAERYIAGAITMQIVPVEADLASLYFDLSTALTVDSVRYQDHQIDFAQEAGDRLRIDFPALLPEGDPVELTVYYQGEPPNTGFGSFVQSQHAGNPIVWTLSEPYGAKDWWPCKQDLNDKASSVDIFIRIPPGNKAASNGKLVEIIPDGDWQIYHWQSQYPIAAYLIALAVTNYEEYSNWVPTPEGDLQVLNYVFPESLNSAQNQTDAIVEIMQLYIDLFGAYPFQAEKYGHAQFGWGGGMEHQTMSFMGGFNYDLQAHELAHQWFGDKVTCGSWADIWLNEGFATYLTGLTKEFLGSEADWTNWKTSRINSVTSEPDGSVWVDDTTSVNRIFSGRLSYSKGALLLHMLRYQLGDEDFFQGIQNYLLDPGMAYGYAHTDDLQYQLEQASGLDLEEFFADWFYGEGFPSYQIFWDYQDGLLQMKVFQGTSDPSVDFFEMRLPILVKGQGQQQLLEVEHQSDGQYYELPVNFPVEEVIFDPDLWILSAGNEVEQMAFTDMKILPVDRIHLMPNPGRDWFILSEKGAALNLQSLRVYDALGRMISLVDLGNSSSYEYDASSLAPGWYVLEVQSNQGVWRNAWVKE